MLNDSLHVGLRSSSMTDDLTRRAVFLPRATVSTVTYGSDKSFLPRRRLTSTLGRLRPAMMSSLSTPVMRSAAGIDMDFRYLALASWTASAAELQQEKTMVIGFIF